MFKLVPNVSGNVLIVSVFRILCLMKTSQKQPKFFIVCTNFYDLFLSVLDRK